MKLPQSGTDIKCKAAFVLNETAIRKIADVIATSVAKLAPDEYVSRFTVFRANDAFYETESIDEVLNDENSKKRSIKRILLTVIPKKDSSSEPHPPEPILTIDFDQTDECPIRTYVRHPKRDWCFLVTDDLNAQFDRITNSRLQAFINRGVCRMLFGFGISAGLVAASFFLYRRNNPTPDFPVGVNVPTESLVRYLESSLSGKIYSAYFILAGFLLFFLLGYFDFTNLLTKAFGTSVFCWGDAEAAYASRREWVNRIVWIVFVGLILSYVGGKMANIF